MLLALTQLSLAQQQTKSSRWRSSSGSVIDVTTSETWITVKVTPRQGQARTWNGRWLRKYDLFEYEATGGTRTCQMVGNTVTVTDPQNKRYTWTLMGVTGSGQNTQNSNYPYAKNVSGRWSSSSGNIFDVTPQGSQVTVRGFLTDGREITAQGRWINQVSFTYHFTGFKNPATATLLKDGRLKVVAPGGTTSYWSKM